MRYLYLFLLSVLSTPFVYAGGVKFYVGSSNNSSHYSNHYFMELIVCNNTIDTVFIKREDLDNLYPTVTNDVSNIVDGGSRFLVTNVDELAEADAAAMFDNDPDGTDADREDMFKKQASAKEENNSLRQINIKDEQYYVILPNKCITVNSYSQSGRQEISKLRDVKEQDVEKLKVYYVVPVWMSNSKDHIYKRELLISRESKALKKCLFYKKK